MSHAHSVNCFNPSSSQCLHFDYLPCLEIFLTFQLFIDPKDLKISLLLEKQPSTVKQRSILKWSFHDLYINLKEKKRQIFYKKIVPWNLDTLLYYLWQIFSLNLLCFLIRTNWILLCFPSLGFILKNILTGSLYSSSPTAFKWMWNSAVNVGTYQWAIIASVLILPVIIFFSPWEVCHSLKWKIFFPQRGSLNTSSMLSASSKLFLFFYWGNKHNYHFLWKSSPYCFSTPFYTEDLVSHWKHWY